MQISGFGRALESTDVPLDLTGIEAQLFGHHESLRMPLLNIGREFNKDLAIMLDDFEALEAAKESPDFGRIEGKALILRPGLTGFLNDIQGNHGHFVPVDPGKALEDVFPR